MIDELQNSVNDEAIQNNLYASTLEEFIPFSVKDKSGNYDMSLTLNKLTIIDTGDCTYGVEILSRKKEYIKKNLDYSEIKDVFNAMIHVRDYIINYKNNSNLKKTYYFRSKDGLTVENDFSWMDPVLRIYFDDDCSMENACTIDSIEDINRLLNFFANVDNMIDYHEKNDLSSGI